MEKSRKRMKRKLAMLVAAVMLAAQLPATAMAANTYAGDGRAITGTEYPFVIIKDGITIKTSDESNVEYKAGDGFKLKKNGAYEIFGTWNVGTLTGVNENNKKTVITVMSGVEANITLNNLRIDASNKEFREDYACALAVEPNGKAAIALSGTNTLISGYNCAGLEVPELAVVSIDGGNADKLIARSGAEGINGQGAGIGGSMGGSGGSIAIYGGVVTATSNQGAGIGGGRAGSGGSIAIHGGAVTATSDNGAGIGGGDGNGLSSGGGGDIAINGGVVTAKSGFGAGIGGGDGGSGGNITITGGMTTATSIIGAGIGGGYGTRGYGGSGGNITITGGITTATSITGVGIGGGYGGDRGGDGGAFTIDGDAVVFAKSANAKAIGGGSSIIVPGDDGTKELKKGVVFEGNKGEVHGHPKFPCDVEIPAGYELTVPDGASLTIPDGIELKNDGTIKN